MYAVCNKNRVLAQMQCLSTEHNPVWGHHLPINIVLYQCLKKIFISYPPFYPPFCLRLSKIMARPRARARLVASVCVLG